MGVRRENAALLQRVQAPPGGRSSRKQPEQAWRTLRAAQLIVSCRYGFVAMSDLRLFYDAYWHRLWRWARLGLLFPSSSPGAGQLLP
jgi:hypothetical protein